MDLCRGLGGVILSRAGKILSRAGVERFLVLSPDPIQYGGRCCWHSKETVLRPLLLHLAEHTLCSAYGGRSSAALWNPNRITFPTPR